RVLGFAIHAPVQKRQRRGLGRRKLTEPLCPLSFDTFFERFSEFPVEVALQDFGMYIAFSANRRGIAEAMSNAFDSAAHVALGGGFAVEGLELRKRYGCQHSASP